MIVHVFFMVTQGGHIIECVLLWWPREATLQCILKALHKTRLGLVSDSQQFKIKDIVQYTTAIVIQHTGHNEDYPQIE